MSVSEKSENQVTLIQNKLSLLSGFKGWQEVLHPWLRTELTYTSNSLEGNTLSLTETSIIINDNQSVAGKNLREVYEAQNHAKAWDFIQDNLILKQTTKLTEQDLLNIHSFILKNIDEANAGKYRNVAVRIAGSNNVFPNYLKVPDLMSEFLIWLQNQVATDLRQILETAILSHLKIVKIHPFTNGNGRTARLFMNTILMQNDLPPINILPENRLQYLESLEESTEGSPQKFIDFCLEQYNQSLDTYLQTFN